MISSLYFSQLYHMQFNISFWRYHPNAGRKKTDWLKWSFKAETYFFLKDENLSPSHTGAKEGKCSDLKYDIWLGLMNKIPCVTSHDIKHGSFQCSKSTDLQHMTTETHCRNQVDMWLFSLVRQIAVSEWEAQNYHLQQGTPSIWNSELQLFPSWCKEVAIVTWPWATWSAKVNTKPQGNILPAVLSNIFTKSCTHDIFFLLTAHFFHCCLVSNWEYTQ